MADNVHGSSSTGSSAANATTATATNVTKTSIFGPPELTRLVTIAAHVDHGKTTLADNLIERNGIISERAAGTVRYLDSDPEEQRRGITMRSSAIGLQHKHTMVMAGGSGGNKGPSSQSQQTMIIHLLDSPGHSDFSREVSSSMLACDTAILVVDAVEGMGARTQQVFRECETYQLVPILIINKIDRLYSDLGLSATEAYVRLRTLLETVNAAAASMINSAQLLRQTNSTTNSSSPVASTNDEVDNDATTQKETRERLWTFDPAVNVIFASALYGWGFTVQSLCRSLYKSGRIAIKPPLLKPHLFGDYKLKDGTTSKLVKWKQTQSSNDDTDNLPLFAEFALQPIWNIYEGVAVAAATVGLGTTSNTNIDTETAPTAKKSNSNNNDAKLIRADTPGMDIVLQALQVGNTTTATTTPSTLPSSSSSTLTTVDDLQNVLTRTGAGRSGHEATLRAILRRYRPLADAVLDAVCDYGPSPAMAARTTRREALRLQQPEKMTALLSNSSNDNDNEFERIKSAVQSCNASNDAPCVAHVCKFLATDPLHVRDSELTATLSSINGGSSAGATTTSHTNLILGLARVLSGRLQTGSEYYVFGPKYQSSSDSANLPRRKIRLYLLMGSSFVLVNEVPAGHLCAIFGLEDVQLKTATLSDNVHCQPLIGFAQGVRPLVKVNIEPELTADANYLEQGLQKLSLADSGVEVTATDKGERILACLGELHLEQSILDLERIYCGKEGGIKLRVSDPIVDFAESTDWFEHNATTTSSTSTGTRYHEIDNFASFFDDIASPPLRQATIPPYNEEEGIALARNGRMRAMLSGRSAAISVRVVPLAECIHQSLKAGHIVVANDNDDTDTASLIEQELIKLGRALNCGTNSNGDEGSGEQALTAESVFNDLLHGLCSVGPRGTALVECAGLRNGSCVRGVVAPHVHIVPSMSVPHSDMMQHHGNAKDETNDVDDVAPVEDLIVGLDEYTSLRTAMRQGAFSDSGAIEIRDRTDADMAAHVIWTKAMKGSTVAGFEMAIRAGPICEEPMRNVLVILEGVEVAVSTRSSSNSDAKEDDNAAAATTSSTTSSSSHYESSKLIAGGMVVSALRVGIRCALLSRPARLMEGHVRLTLHSSLAGLGALYQVLSKRRGRVIEDSMVDGTDLLMITALIPQAEAFGLTPELFAKTSGEVTAPEMLFSHWERMDIDPFWIPSSEEEREDFGELQTAGDSSTGLDNRALSYIRQVRKRKGLTVDSSRTVQNAEKQRTLKR